MLRVEMRHTICHGRFMGVDALFNLADNGRVCIFFPAEVVKEAEESGCTDWSGKTRQSTSSYRDSTLTCTSPSIFAYLVSHLSRVNSEDIPDKLALERMASFICDVMILSDSPSRLDSLSKAIEELFDF